MADLPAPRQIPERRLRWLRTLADAGELAATLVVKYELRFELRLRRNFILRVITSNYVRNILHDSDYEILHHFLLRSPKYA
jgi:hypothetical protein